MLGKIIENHDNFADHVLPKLETESDRGIFGVVKTYFPTVCITLMVNRCQHKSACTG